MHFCIATWFFNAAMIGKRRRSSFPVIVEDLPLDRHAAGLQAQRHRHDLDVLCAEVFGEMPLAGSRLAQIRYL
jgi:hypothetical protein